MNKRGIVFSDVDGTLLNSDHQITPLTQKAIHTLAKKGIPFVIVSARSPSGIYPILDAYGFECPVISYSGAFILDENREVLFHKGMCKSDARRILSFIEKEHLDLSWCVYSLDEWVVKDKTDPRIIREERIVKAEAKQGTIDDITDNQINKILCICNPAQILDLEKNLKKVFPAYSIVKSSDILLEIMENGIAKDAAIKTFCSLRDAKVKDAVAFGDNYNDVEMLNTVGYGFLMANAPEDLKKNAANIAADHNHDGIYYALRDLHLI